MNIRKLLSREEGDEEDSLAPDVEEIDDNPEKVYIWRPPVEWSSEDIEEFAVKFPHDELEAEHLIMPDDVGIEEMDLTEFSEIFESLIEDELQQLGDELGESGHKPR